MRSEKLNERQFDKWELLSRMPGFSFIIPIIIFNLCVFSLLFLVPELVTFIWVDIVFIIIGIIVCICIKLVYSKYRQVIRIINNAYILEAPILKAESVHRFSRDYNPKYFLKISCGDVFVSATYFDKVKERQYLFEGYYDLPPYSRNSLYQRGKSLKDLEKIHILVNKNNYNEYVILLKEELENPYV